MKVLFTSWPAWGHLLPILPLARALRQAGHSVVLATGQDMQEDLIRHGFDTWAVGPTAAQAHAALYAAHPDHDSVPREQKMAVTVARMFGPAGAQRAEDLLPRAESWAPDVVISTPGDPAGAVVATRTGARHVIHSVGLVIPGIESVMSLLTAAAGERFGIDDLYQRVTTAPVLDIGPASLRLPGAPLLANARPLRPSPGDPDPDPDIAARIAALPYQRTVYLTLGTIFNGAPRVFEAALAGLAGLSVNVVITTGPGVDQARFGRPGRHVLMRPRIAQASVLPWCDAVISHAGAGTMLGALCFGRPQVSLPMGADQPFNASAVQRAGAGLTVEPDSVTPDNIAAAAERILKDPPFAQAAQRVQQEILGMPAPADVAQGLTDLVTAA